jgi:transposase
METTQSTLSNVRIGTHVLSTVLPQSCHLPNQLSCVLGIDIAKDKFDVCLLLPDPKGKQSHKQRAKVFSNTAQGFVELHAWVGTLTQPYAITTGVIHVCMEATGIYWEALAHALIDYDYPVSVCNPAQIASYGDSQLQRGKTDKQDAALIARYCLREQPMLYVAPSKAQRTLLILTRQQLRLRDSLVAERLRLQTCQHDVVASSISQVIDCLETQLKAIAKAITEHIDQDPDLKRDADLLASVPAVGVKTVPSLLAYLGDGSRFTRGKQAAAFAGLSPRQHESGSSVRGKTHISKTGHDALRALLYMPAMGTYGKRRAFVPFIDRLTASGKQPMEIIVALMRKILTIAQAVLKSKTPFNPLIHAV